VVWEAIRQARNRKLLDTQRVLATLYRISEEHQDPAYPAEGGMVNAYYGANVTRALRRLERRGLVDRRAHMPEEGVHWTLTDRGRREAERILGGLDPLEG
jgi:manganese/zinc/iron transport system permease protein